MDNSLAFGRVRGIGIRVHYSWLLVLALLTASLASGFYPATFPGLAPSTGWLLGLLSALGLLVSVLLHELAHALVWAVVAWISWAPASVLDDAPERDLHVPRLSGGSARPRFEPTPGSDRPDA